MNNIYYLVRHGLDKLYSEKKHNGWTKNNPLTKKGKNQANKAKKILDLEKIDLIFSSDILRAKQTARIISKGLGVEITEDKRLRDLRRSKKMEGMHFSKFTRLKNYKKYMKNKNRPNFKLPDGESTNDLNKRVDNFINFAENTYKNKKILLSCHCATIQSLAKNLTNKRVSLKKISHGSIHKVHGVNTIEKLT